MKKVLNSIAAGLLLAASICFAGCDDPSNSKKVISDPNPDPDPVVIPERGPDYSAAIIGDIILADGKVCKVDNFDSSTMTAVAVIIREATFTESALGIALEETSTHTPWAISTADGYTKYISGMYTWFKDSSESLKVIAQSGIIDFNTEGNYPAWEYCYKYGINKSFAAPFNAGWCLPTYYELDSLKDTSAYAIIDPAIRKVGGTYLKYASSVKTGIDSSTRADLKTETWYATCNSNGGNIVLHNLSSTTEGDKETGRSSATTKYITIKMIARPVYHFVNDANTLCLPVISDKSSGKVTIKTKEIGTQIHYQLDGGTWVVADAPAEVVLDSNAHTITAYASKEGLRKSSPVTKEFAADSVY